MPARATRARRFPRALAPIGFGPFTSLWDGDDPSAAPAGAAKVLTNLYIGAEGPGAPVYGRPGFALFGTAGSPDGGVGARTGQYVGQFTTLNGTTRTIKIVGGKFYTGDWSTRTWTETLTSAHFAAASGGAITLSTTARVFSAVLGNQIVFSDGTNTPWMWDGTAGGGLTKLTNCPVLYGPIVVYYSKLFGIKATARGTMVWSEERDPETGYDVGGYNNAWDYDVTGTDPLTALAATNEALYVFRARSVSAVYGRVNDDFETDGTRAGVDEQIGTIAPPLATRRGVWFVDALGRPHVLVPGGGVVPLWQPSTAALASVNTAALEAGVYILPRQELDAVLVGLPTGGESGPTTWLVYRQSGDGAARYIGTFTGWTSDAAGVVLDGDDVPTVMHLGADDGYAYDHAHPTGDVWSDTTVNGSSEVPTSIAHVCTAHPLRPSVDTDIAWDRLTWLVRAVGTGPYSVRVRTPRGRNTAQEVTISGVSGSRLGVGLTGSFVLAGEASEARVVVGLKQFGRWLEPSLQMDELDQEIAIIGGVARGVETGEEPTIT